MCTLETRAHITNLTRSPNSSKYLHLQFRFKSFKISNFVNKICIDSNKVYVQGPAMNYSLSHDANIEFFKSYTHTHWIKLGTKLLLPFNHFKFSVETILKFNVGVSWW